MIYLFNIMNQLIQKIEKQHIESLGFSQKRFNFKVGDDIVVKIKVPDKNGFRIQNFTGRCIAIKSPISSGSNFTVIKHQGTKVIRIFPMFSPLIEGVEVKTVGYARRAKLYYLKNRSGKSARIREPKIIKEKKINKNLQSL